MSSYSYFLVCVSTLLMQNALCQVPNFGLPNKNVGVNTIASGVGCNTLSPGLVNPGLVTPGLVNPGILTPGLVNPGLFNAGLAVNGLNPGLNGLGFPGVPNVVATASVPVGGPFVSAGTAELAVGGDFGVGGSTVVGGQVPVVGAVSFGGQIPAGGVVSIAGNCGCASYPL